jgi:hypothetical protein
LLDVHHSTLSEEMNMLSKRRRVQWRSLTTFLVVMIFTVIAITGIVLYITPPGRIANWSGWSLLGLTKAQWQSVHTIFAFLFVLTASVHLYFNWKVLMGYLRVRIELGRKYGREFVASFVIVLSIFALTINHVAPFGSVMDFGEDVKNSWSSTPNEPPVPHAELLTLSELSKRTDLPSQTVRTDLESAGFTVPHDSVTLKELADQKGITPQEVFTKIKTHNSEGNRPKIGEGGGYGRKTVAEICQQLSVPISEGLRRLESKSVTAKPGSNIRELAMVYGMSPSKMVQVIAGEAE